MKEVVIVDALRTPMGRSRGGVFRDVRAEELGASCIRALLKRNPALPVDEISEVVWGCVQQTLEQGFNIGRNTALMAGLPVSIPAQTTNRLCGSSMTALHIASMSILTGQGDAYIVGGVEHMGHVPMNHGIDFAPQIELYMARGAGSMGATAELLSQKYGITRQMQDEFAMRSHQSAAQATEKKGFEEEIISVLGNNSKGVPESILRDEVIRPETNMETLAKLPPAFMPKVGTVTAGNASAISDGASAILVMEKKRALELGLRPLAKVVSFASTGVDPSVMGLGPVKSVQQVLKRGGVSLKDVGLMELNEAFAAQSLAVLTELGIEKEYQNWVNTKGGAIALGHPLGCSGSRITTTLVHTMKGGEHKHGISTMCVGMGQGVATLLENLT